MENATNSEDGWSDFKSEIGQIMTKYMSTSFDNGVECVRTIMLTLQNGAMDSKPKYPHAASHIDAYILALQQALEAVDEIIPEAKRRAQEQKK
jgi:hypothetical protein